MIDWEFTGMELVSTMGGKQAHAAKDGIMHCISLAILSRMSG